MDQNIKNALEKQNPWWFKKGFETGIERLSSYPSIIKYLKTPEILLLVGARRTGKSTLLYQIIKKLLKDNHPKTVLFINVDEPLFQSRSEDPNLLSTIVEEYLAENREIKELNLFIDEVQNHKYWVNSIKILSDTHKNLKIFLTGSSSTLLKSAATTKLSGRCFNIKIYPLSFKEYLKFNNIDKPAISDKKSHFIRYLKFGSFPRVVLEKDESLKREILKNYFQTIYLKDIIYPHNLRNNKDVFDLLYFIVSNVGRPFSYSNIARTLNIAVDTAKEYLQYAEESYIVSSINKFDNSVRKQIANPKKIYCIDTGLVNSISFRFSENKGWLFENLVFIRLLQKDYETYYNKGTYECDFLVKEKAKVTKAIQVSVSLSDEKTKKREIKGLLEAMNMHNLKEGLILTENENEEIKIEGKKIVIKPIYEWILE